MKFGKALETNAEAMPEGWRPYLIQYKALKKKINAIVKELDDRGLPSPIIKNLLSQTLSGDMQRLEYSFDEDKKHLRTHIKVVLDDLTPGTGDGLPFGPMPLTQEEEQLSKLFAHELAFLNSSASSSSSDLQEQLVQDQNGSEHDSEGQDQEGKPNTGLEDLLDDTTLSETSEETSIGDEDRSSNAGDKELLEFNSSPSSPLTPPSPTLSHETSTPLAELTDDINNDQAPSMDHSSSSTSALTHGPSTGTVSSNKSTSHTPSPLSQPPHQPQPDQEQSQAFSTTSAADTSSTSSLLSEPVETLITPGAAAGNIENVASSRILTTEEDGKRVLVIELTADTAFFDQLGEEVSQLSKLQQANKLEFESKVNDLSKILTVVSSPHNKDMYTWREILKIYLDAQVFVGDQETDRSTRSSEKAQTQLQWFLKEMDRSKLTQKFKQSKSKIAFNTFFQLNSELITMKQFKELNQMAMTKILKKHDKRTNLSASLGFPKHLQNEPFYSDNISKSLTYTIGNQLISIIPQPDDYSCPICMSVAWKPIRLNCKHVFCVRCLIKAQRKRMVHCPVCRQTNSVHEADASNLDVSMMNFLKLYFPKEIKEKRKESSKEQAVEEMEALTGRRFTDNPDPCLIM
ncbi:hypothetical protein EC957_001683 [Mortierella hygrophila]|uniref:SPX domain-containing protein n=1 Tax=Mortierella hygrophila TaxID=979708 RepID=A0A9P6F5Z7_9FUNG|nr:hypothetical protein EC957_001683 [Mortierella hygrophila]